MGRMQLACVLLAILAPVSCQSSQDSFDKLRKSLLGTYDKGALPFVPTGLQVEFELVLTTLIEVNTAGESIEFESWWRMYWTDPRLSWDPAQHGGMTQIVLKHTEVWRPDVILFEKIKDVISTTRVQVSSTGDVLWSAPHITKLGCPMSVEAFPYDTQTCNFTIGSWTYDGSQLDVAPRRKDLSSLVPPGSDVPPRSALDLAPYTQVEPWTLEVARVLWKDTYYGCCPEPFPVLIFEFQLQRASRTLFSGVITPMLLVSFIGFAIFLIPAPISGARPNLSVRMLLTYVTVYFVASSSTPQSNKSTTIARMYVAGIIFAGLQVILSILTTALNMVAPDAGKGADKWAQVFRELDEDEDGVLDQRELARACRLLGLGHEDKRQILAMVDEREDGTLTAEQWRLLGELASTEDDRATYHNKLVQRLVQGSLKSQLHQHQAQPLSQLADAEPDPTTLFPVYEPVERFHNTTVLQSVSVPQPVERYAAASTGEQPGARQRSEIQLVHGAAFGGADHAAAIARDEDLARNRPADLRNRQQRAEHVTHRRTPGLSALTQKLEAFTSTPSPPARVGRIISAWIDSWALWIMLPTYVIYLILEFTGVWSGYLVKGHEAGFGNTPEQNKVKMELYDYRSFGELRCYSYTPDFGGDLLGLMGQAEADCKTYESSQSTR